MSAAAQLCLTSSGIEVAQMKIPVKSNGSGGVVLDLHRAPHEQNLAVSFRVLLLRFHGTGSDGAPRRTDKSQRSSICILPACPSSSVSISLLF